MADDTYLVWSFERGQWWAPNKFGYTSDVIEAGRYQKHDAESICQSANIGSMVNEDMVHTSDMRRIIDLQKITRPFKKPAIEDVVKEFTQGYHSINPVGKIIEKLKENYHYPEEFNVPHVGYETTERLEIGMKNANKKLVVSLYRMPSGSYECILYTGKNESKNNTLDEKPSSNMKFKK
jgi:hypothetical protein